MAILSGRHQLFFWVPAALIAVGLVVAVFVQIRRLPTERRALYIVGVPEKGAALFFGDKQCGICHSVNGSGGAGRPGPFRETTRYARDGVAGGDIVEPWTRHVAADPPKEQALSPVELARNGGHPCVLVPGEQH
jgi:mono/diheme cytochrome c family protein